MSDRTLCDSTKTSRTLAKLSELAYGLFGFIFQETDDYGRLDTDPLLIKAQRFPLITWITPEMVEHCIQEYQRVGMLFLWQEIDHRYGYFVGFEGKSGRYLSKRRSSQIPKPPSKELAKFLKDNNHFQTVPTVPNCSYKSSQVKLSQEENKESNPPSAASTSPSVEKLNTNPKKSWREIQDRKIEKTQKEWVEIFNQKISAGQLQLLVHGSKKHGVDGFKSYEALWIWMHDCKSPGQKPKGDAFLYAKALAKDWGGVKGYSQRAWGRMKDAQVIADVFDEIKIRYGKTGD